MPAGGGLPFWGFTVALIWRGRVGTDFSGLFRFGPKPGGFVIQKRNETPETPETPETLETPILRVNHASHLVSRSQARLVSRASRLVRGPR